MKNGVISMMGAYIITSCGIWVYADLADLFMIFLVSAMIIAICLSSLDDYIRKIKRKARMKQKRLDEFRRFVNETTKNRP